ncbi:hypothetical protein A2382_03770 [Candidatus Woesebacteria bacterium RIFOXYB1_FULL_38_16]|uniref:EamA domain-containing protein n=1 Tax=Candidatus Woesebacteria bacterium RIFOXYB1_FULL_38_16 TaxID=1802538 RepID=A0A1F8CSN3_9BACT|nr:MAG: hypothetical protein A2191_02260 [Candidatus Woesebacteria bacterium RIFOXYA1_FULL_38_9]OGM78768.1 MAG: hypothetical protein A2382_03770 [Candidatus Woesebacteria bacterium RIFOXYB1_FULL_38_16]
MSKRRVKAYLILLIPTIIWGIAGSVIKFTLSDFSPFIFLFYRFFYSALIAIFYFFYFRPKLPKDLTTWLQVIIYAAFGNVLALVFLFWGLNKSTVLDFTIIDAFGPIIVSIAGAVILNDRITRKEKLGITLAFAGIVFTIFKPLVTEGLAIERFLGNSIILAFVLLDSFGYILTKILVRKNVKAFTLSNLSFLLGFFLLAPLVLGYYGVDAVTSEIKSASFSAHLGVIFMAVFSGTLAYALWTLGQKAIEVSEAAVFRYLMPLISTPIAVLWLGEKITWQFLAGALVIFTGVSLAEYKKTKR